MAGLLSEPLRLPCGQVLPNRLAKAAMTEGLGDPLNRATDRHVRLYGRWADAGLGSFSPAIFRSTAGISNAPATSSIDGPQSPEQLAALKAWTSRRQGRAARKSGRKSLTQADKRRNPSTPLRRRPRP